MTDVQQAYVRVWLAVDGDEWHGTASDLLPPKWFTKDPEKMVALELEEMIQVIKLAMQFSIGLTAESVFALWQRIYSAQAALSKGRSIPPLLAHFGTSLVERALIDAFCRSQGRPFFQLLRQNLFGIRLDQIHPELGDRGPSHFLSDTPLDAVTVRQTVGLSDPLTDEEIAPADRLDDGLPQSLSSSIQSYGLRHLKIKLSGTSPDDIQRLCRIAEIVGLPPGFGFSLDGNEQFQSANDFRAWWEALQADPALTDFLKRLLFVEQPIHRTTAFAKEAGQVFSDWPRRPPIIIDESDGAIEDLETALTLGYSGTSHKNCKGVFKGIAHRCLLTQRTRAGSNRVLLMSGEDLCTVGPVSLQQDLAIMAALGIQSVERNGHHYHAGLSQFPAPLQQSALKHHPDLYGTIRGRWPAVRISRGELQLGTTNRAPFGVDFSVDLDPFPKVQ
jgi:L-alanine-DL-glutamate epimerase-like enolase superfamily enzyme